MKTYIVSDQIGINASKEKVWEVITDPAYIKQWDDIPENYNGGTLRLNSVLEWEGHAKLTVTEFREKMVLKLSMFLPKVSLHPSQYDVSYKYSLTDFNGITTLKIEVGDFSPLSDPQQYVDSTLEFVEKAKQQIKELAEG